MLEFECVEGKRRGFLMGGEMAGWRKRKRIWWRHTARDINRCSLSILLLAIVLEQAGEGDTHGHMLEHSFQEHTNDRI